MSGWSEWYVYTVCIECNKRITSYGKCCPHCGNMTSGRWKKIPGRYRITSPWWKFWRNDKEWEWRDEPLAS